MIYLIGVDHKIQHDGKNSYNKNKRKAFSDYIVNKVKDLSICLLAEEFNEDALDQSSANESTVRKVAKKIGVDHRFCDPGYEIRRELGIPKREEIISNLDFEDQINKVGLTRKQEKEVSKETKKYFSQREKHWFKKIKDKIDLNINIIFICGSSHIHIFESLLNDEGIKVKILVKDFDKILN